MKEIDSVEIGLGLLLLTGGVLVIYSILTFGDQSLISLFGGMIIGWTISFYYMTKEFL